MRTIVTMCSRATNFGVCGHSARQARSACSKMPGHCEEAEVQVATRNTGTRLKAFALQFSRNLRATPPPAWPWPAGIWRGLLVGLIVAAGAMSDHYEASLFVALGAFCLLLIDPAVPLRGYVIAIIALSVSISVAALLAGLVGASWLMLPLLVVLAYFYGAYSASPAAGPAAFGAAMFTLLIAIAVGQSSWSGRQSLQVSALVLLGCGIGLVVDLATWRWERVAFIRHRIRIGIRKVGLLAGTSRSAISAQVGAAVRAELDARRVATAAQLPLAQRATCFAVIDALMELRLTTAAWLSAANPSVRERTDVATAIKAVGAAAQRRAPDEPALPASVQPTRLRASVDNLAARIGAFTRSVSDPMDSARTQERVVAPEAIWIKPSNHAADVLHPGTTSGRHGLRMALGIGIAETIDLATGLRYGEWIAVAVVYLLKPDFAATLSRGALRLLGTMAAVLLVGSVVSVTHAQVWVLVTMIAIFCALAVRWGTINYGLASFAIAGAVLFFVTVPGDVDLESTKMRLFNTGVGAVVALVSYSILPSWRSKTLGEALLVAGTAVQSWQRAVLAGVGKPTASHPATTRDLGRVARDAVFAADAVAEASVLEPSRGHGDPVAGLEFLSNLHRAAAPLLSLEFSFGSWRATSEIPSQTAAAQLAAEVLDRDFAFALEALGGGPHRLPSDESGADAVSLVGDPRVVGQLNELIEAIADARIAATAFMAPSIG